MCLVTKSLYVTKKICSQKFMRAEIHCKMHCRKKSLILPREIVKKSKIRYPAYPHM
jgi:hypothetical protein